MAELGTGQEHTVPLFDKKGAQTGELHFRAHEETPGSGPGSGGAAGEGTDTSQGLTAGETASAAGAAGAAGAGAAGVAEHEKHKHEGREAAHEATGTEEAHQDKESKGFLGGLLHRVRF